MSLSDTDDVPQLPDERAAWAKVNLTLQVTGRRPDGYHELDSLVVFAGVGDRLTLEPAESFSLLVEGPRAKTLTADGENLVAKAAALLLRHAEPGATLPTVRLRLDKHLPVASGIGGGSADAAAALALLMPRMRLRERPDSDAVIVALGADVPVCLFGRPAIVSGIGETIRRAPPLPAAWLVLANPGQPLSTPAVFKAREGGFSVPQVWPESFSGPDDLAAHLKAGGNDLEPPARRLLPAIDGVLAALADSEGCLLARMSGSGATCFGLYAARPAAEAAQAALSSQHPDWWVAAAPLLHGPSERSWWDGPAR